MFVLVASTEDAAAINIRDRLLEFAEWEEAGTFSEHTVYKLISGNQDVILFTTDEKILYWDNLDKDLMASDVIDGKEEPGSLEVIIVLSRHRAASGKPTLTVHPIGNWNNADFGGKERTLVPTSPFWMSEALRCLKRRTQEMELTEFGVSFEATHHGPFLESPIFFIEIGSDESKWELRPPAEAIAKALLDLFKTEWRDDPVAVGLGGGHYQPRITDVILDFRMSVGHMIPTYAMESNPKHVVDLALEKTPKAKHVYVHRKAMKGAQRRYYIELFDTRGIPVLSSKALDRLGD